MKHLKHIMLNTAFLLISSQAMAAEGDVPFTFKSGTTAIAEEVNANFTSLQDQLATLKETVDELNAALAVLQADTIVGLADVLSVEDDFYGHSTVIFSGVNLRVHNNATFESTNNGLGNIIIGRNGATSSNNFYCSNGIYTAQAGCEGSGNVWATIHKTGSHNLVIGSNHNYSRNSGLVVGSGNSILANSSVSMGISNVAADKGSSVVGGRRNTAIGDYSSVSGGFNNIASGNYSSVSGGVSGKATGQSSSISGGQGGSALGQAASISGGLTGKAVGDRSSTSGGFEPIAIGSESSVTGGYRNTAVGVRSVVSGGVNREASNINSWRAGNLSESN